MIIKLMGCIMVIGSATAIGFLLADKYKKRPEELRKIQNALQMLEAEIAFSLNTLPDAFDKIGKAVTGIIGKIFGHAAELLNQRTGVTASEAWQQAVERFQQDIHLEKEDKEIILAFGNSLGGSDKEHQIKNIRLACTKLEMEEKKALQLRDKNEKLYKNLGVLAGILLALMFI